MSELTWVQVARRGRVLGGGLLLTSRLVVTAAHCVRCVDIAADDHELAISVSGSKLVGARLLEVAAGADLALLKLDSPVGAVRSLPMVTRGAKGDAWFAPYRPTEADPELDGKVSQTLLYRCRAGETIVAVQLTTDSNLGNFSGYSGGPVYLWPEDGGRAIGLLIEQYPDRIDPSRSTNIIFAAALEGVFDHFVSLRDEYLIRLLVAGSRAATGTSSQSVSTAAVGDGSQDAKSGQGAVQLVTGSAESATDNEYEEAVSNVILERLMGLDDVEPELRLLHQALVSKWIVDQSSSERR